MITSMARPTHANGSGTTPVYRLAHHASQPAATSPRHPQEDPQAQLHALVKHLVVDGDTRALRAGRKTPRTLADMTRRLADSTPGGGPR
ncbi:hypothetical protein [Streptomyces aureoversilis]|uniref:Uncharacterized protein n=1 Tax=Streptomyces aureoversilis TaxID=67277 RepID=A0ABW0A8T0_9ACTN